MEVSPEKLAERFHYWYEYIAPNYEYETRRDSSVPWERVPEPNKTIMIETAREVIAELGIKS